MRLPLSRRGVEEENEERKAMNDAFFSIIDSVHISHIIWLYSRLDGDDKVKFQLERTIDPRMLTE